MGALEICFISIFDNLLRENYGFLVQKTILSLQLVNLAVQNMHRPNMFSYFKTNNGVWQNN